MNRMSAIDARASLVALSLMATLGCSATTNGGAPAVTSEFSAQDATRFDDSVDYAENIQQLGGRVATQWRAQVDGLSNNADLIVAVRIETVNSGTEPSGSSVLRLDAVATESPIRGQITTDRRVELRASEGESGFNQIHGNETRLQRGVYVLWVKWYSDADHTVRAHWHLSPRSDALVARIREAIGYIDPNAPRETVIRTGN